MKVRLRFVRVKKVPESLEQLFDSDHFTTWPRFTSLFHPLLFAESKVLTISL